jgi:two-component system nitrate/nitrite response regulator NarL
MRTITIALADIQPVVLEGLSAFLARCDGVYVVGMVRCAEDVLRLFEREAPDVLVLDLNLPGDCLTTIRKIRSHRSKTKIIIFTDVQDPALALQSLNAGVDAYVLKHSSAAEFMHAIEAALDGKSYISPEFAGQVLAASNLVCEPKSFKARQHLSIRDEQIVQMLLRGKNNREIAQVLSLSEKTVKNYMTGLMSKLNAKSRLEVVMLIQQQQDRGPTLGTQFSSTRVGAQP